MTLSGNESAGHRKRLREKFLKSGLKGFHDYEIIELLLSLGTPRKDCKPQAKEPRLIRGTFAFFILQHHPLTLASLEKEDNRANPFTTPKSRPEFDSGVSSVLS